jgi:hypothetical protein
MAILDPRRRRARRLWASITTVTVMAAVFLFVIASATATLAGSSFESSDGNLAATAPSHDWNLPIEPINCTTHVNCGTDLIKSTSDNAFGQGAKEDIPNPTEVTGSIPPNKSDLMRFYVNKEKAGSPAEDYLYLAWERSNVLGSANMDFEFNQSATTPTGKVTPLRTAGDMLVTFDFTNGGSNPVLGLLRWLTGAPATASDCFSANSLPCWGQRQIPDLLDGVDDERLNLSSAGFADGAVNTSTVTDTNTPPVAIPGQTAGTLPGLTFGEAGINLSDAGVFSAGTCAHFGAAFLKSRSSASFTAELKDFIAPIPVNISNCGTVNIHKQDDLGAPLEGAVFTLFTDNTPVDGAPPHGAEDVATSLTCTTEADGDCSITDVPFGNYWAVETTGVPNHELAADQTVGLTATTPNQTISLTFVDPRQPGAILITKTAKNKSLGAGQHPLAGAVFDVTDADGISVGGGTSDSDGEVCVGGLTIGDTYTVTESDAPDGYSIDTTSQDVTITGSSTCGSGDEDTVTFTDTPLTDISVTSTSQVAGATGSKISCVDADGNTVGTDVTSYTDPASDSATGLEPGVYTCTIDIDP